MTMAGDENAMGGEATGETPVPQSTGEATGETPVPQSVGEATGETPVPQSAGEATGETPVPQATAGQRSRAQASPLAQALRVFDLSIGQMLWSRRTIFMGLVVSAPMALALIYRLLQSSFGDPRMHGQAIQGTSFFGIAIWLLYLRFIVPILGVFYGTSLIADEVDDKTITYLFVRPIARGSILFGKYLGYMASTGLVVLPSVMVVYFLTMPFDIRAIGNSFPSLLKDLGLLGLGLAVYGALFALVGARMKHPLVAGLVFVFGWEQLALAIPGYLRRFTVAYYLQAMVPHAMPQDSLMSMVQSVFREAPPAWVCLGWLAGIWLVCLLLGARTVARREYVLEQ
jgi:ABC-type transport system involved in multi-copper enzyme maturation permease subunit